MPCSAANQFLPYQIFPYGQAKALGDVVNHRAAVDWPEEFVLFRPSVPFS